VFLASLIAGALRREFGCSAAFIAGTALAARAAVCQTILRSIDVFGRLGGEEFGLVLPACSLDEGVEMVERMRAVTAAMPVDVNSPGA
jgi:PleD family two-component response regulator